MKAFRWLASLLILLLLLAACSGSNEPSLTIEDAWARPSPLMAGNGAVYMVIRNKGRQADALTGVRTSISQAVELHETKMEGDVMKMRPVAGQRIEIPAQGSVELKPGGLHIMLLGLNQPLEPGKSFELTLQFEKSGERTLTIPIKEGNGM